ncbi:YWTD domain-containing protein [Aspergillus ellipticus CBS 707.79]|uniref:YWTD domain-containing protein n=1 Tax=Aspergillus ellipticus CBS 707.79 TaxID=1448320 RepID=A0A319D3S0_9EURO|nr:YWTD domain-containing protein [Aspergillus ellipticus CBS 707.79]
MFPLSSQSSRPITILGAGILGRRIASVFLAGSYKVHLYDPSHDALFTAKAYIDSSRGSFTALTPTPHPESGYLSVFTDLPSALENAWLVLEAVPEKLELKVATFKEADKHVPRDCILASNSSSFKSRFMASELSEERKTGVLNVHFFMPPEICTVELMTCGSTMKEVMDILVDLLKDCGMFPVVTRRESTGFIFNRLWAAIKREILYILSEEVSTPGEIDLLWKSMFSAPGRLSPCRFMDHIGLDTVALIEDNYIKERGLDGMSVEWLRDQFISKGRLGNKSKLGGLYPPEREGSAAQLYVLDVGFGANTEIERCTTSGRILTLSPESGKFTTLVSGLSLPDGLDISPSTGRMFWTNMGSSTATNDGFLQSAQLDGSDVQTILSPGTVHTPKQLIVDDVDHKLYFCDREGLRVHRCNFDGTSHQVLVQTGSLIMDKKDMTRWCVGIALDRLNSYIYWSQRGPSKSGQGRIFRAGVEIPTGKTAQNRDDVECLLEGLPEPIDLEFDGQMQTLYWTDRGEHPMGCSLNRVDLTGGITKKTLKGKMEILARQFHEPIGLKLSKKGIYVADLGGCVSLVTEGKKTVVVQGEGCLTGVSIRE